MSNQPHITPATPGVSDERIGQLEQLVEQQAGEIERLQKQNDGLSTWLETLTGRVAELEDENEELAKRVLAAEETAEAATMGKRNREQGGRETKADHVRRTTRNELIRRSLRGDHQTEVPITVSEVKTMCKPECDPYWQTVRNAWDDLLEEHECFHETTKRGDQALSVDKSGIPRGLKRLVKLDLEQ